MRRNRLQALLIAQSAMFLYKMTLNISGNEQPKRPAALTGTSSKISRFRRKQAVWAQGSGAGCAPPCAVRRRVPQRMGKGLHRLGCGALRPAAASPTRHTAGSQRVGGYFRKAVVGPTSNDQAELSR